MAILEQVTKQLVKALIALVAVLVLTFGFTAGLQAYNDELQELLPVHEWVAQ